jgi:hypothetical protein
MKHEQGDEKGKLRPDIGGTEDQAKKLLHFRNRG